MFYELKLQCSSHSRAKTRIWEAQAAINNDKALPGMGLGRVIADSIISFFLPPSDLQITWALGHCSLNLAQRWREMFKQFIKSETDRKLGLMKCLGPNTNFGELMIRIKNIWNGSLSSTWVMGPNQKVSLLNYSSFYGRIQSHHINITSIYPFAGTTDQSPSWYTTWL